MTITASPGTRRIAILSPSRIGIAATGLTAILCLAVVLAARWGADWPAAQFRAWTAVHDGLGGWTNRWYGGIALPGYSVLYPPVAAVLGAGITGWTSALATAWVGHGLAPAGRRRAALHGGCVAVLLAQVLLIGQVPFLLACPFGLLAVREVLGRGRWWLGVAAAVLCSLASPLAGAFLLLVAPALAVVRPVLRVLPLAGAAAGSAVPLAVGGVDGPFPCQWQALAAVVTFCVLVLVLAPRENRALQIFAGCYLLAAVVAFVVPNPIGGNIGRLGKLLALPLACHFLVVDARAIWTRVRTVIVVGLAVVWPSIPFTTAVLRGAADPSQDGSFYTGLTTFLHGQDPRAGRLEIPFTREHWESYWVARQVPLARGWVRQTDLLDNRVLYSPLSAAAYRTWLDRNAVALVALPRAPLDYGGRPEAALLRHPPAYLRPVWHDAHWQIWRVVGARPLVAGPAVVTHLGPASVTLRFTSAGTARLAIHGSSLWRAEGDACVDTTPGGRLQVSAPRRGTVVLQAGLGAQLVAPASC